MGGFKTGLLYLHLMPVFVFSWIRNIIKNPVHHGGVPGGTLSSMIEAILGAVWIDSNRNLDQVFHVMKELRLY